jgi:hypothetical protein
MPILHPDDQWSPLQKPTDPCQISGCKLMKHKFPFPEKIIQQMPGAGSLSRWCISHTIDKGFCIRCGKMEIANRAAGMCKACEKTVNFICEQNAPGYTAKDITKELIRRSGVKPATYVVNLDV